MTTTVTIAELAPQLRSGQLRAADLLEGCLSAIDARDRELNAFILVARDEGRAAAAEADREIAGGRWRGPLHGIPVSIKDLFDVAGQATTAASKLRAGVIARRDAESVARLRAAGAVFVGKTNLHEFAFGTTNEDSAFGPARNPFDPKRSPGGSSGGSAASVAAGMALATLGTDTGGSIRIPAAACGLVGLKPRFGEISCDGVVPLGRSLDHVGPLTRTVQDAGMLYDVLRGADRPGESRTAATSPLTIGVLRGFFVDRLETDIRRLFDEALERMRRGGHTVRQVEVPHADLIPTTYLHTVLPEAAAYHATMLDTRPADYSPGVRLRLEMGRYVLAEDYIRAQHVRDLLRGEIDQALGSVDVAALPTLPIPAPPIGADSVPMGDGPEPVRAAMLRLTQVFNLTGHAAMSVPMGRTPAGLPGGFQLAGRDTDRLLRAALALEPHINPEFATS
jgi:aspartyl-tRNA(Asn)/glutamyl-tRNA(Gln) amidotransferase subunit A